MSDESVIYAVAGHVATITLNRPEQRNALNYEAYDRLEAAFRRAVVEPEVRCVIVTGADPAFCSGDDAGRSWPAPSPSPQPLVRRSCATARRRPPWRRSSATSR